MSTGRWKFLGSIPLTVLVGESKAALPAVPDSGLQATSAADAKESANAAINPFHFGVGNRRPPGCRGQEISSESVVARLLLVIRTVVVGAFAYDVEVLVETERERATRRRSISSVIHANSFLPIRFVGARLRL